MDQEELAEQLRAICGSESVITDERDLVVYECDAYTLQRNLPTAVVLPRNTEEIVAVVRLCAENELPIIPRGA